MKALGIILLMMSSLGFARDASAGDKGNGGYSIVCRDDAGTITSAELLDIYEGRIIYKKSYEVNQSSVEELVNFGLSRIEYWGSFNSKVQKQIDLIEKNMIMIPEGNELEPTDDAFPPIKKKGCKFEQLANYTNSGEVLVSQEIFDHLDNVNKAAMFIHEAIYAIRRKTAGDTTSQISRKFTANLLAKETDKELNEKLIADTFYRVNNTKPCGLEGSLEDRMEDCSYFKQSTAGMSLVMRDSNKFEIWMDRQAKVLWSDRIPQMMDFKRAEIACASLSNTLADLGVNSWRLPTADEYTSNQYLIQILPNMMSFSKAWWFWTSTSKGRTVKTFNGETGELSFNPFIGSNSGSVRCISNL